MVDYFYQFAIVDVAQASDENRIQHYLVDGSRDCDFYIYTKSPVGGNTVYSDEKDALAHSVPYCCTRIVLHGNRVHLERSTNETGKCKSFQTREDAVAYFNDTVKKYLSADSYRMTEENCDMEISQSVIDEIGRYFVRKEDDGSLKVSSFVAQHCKVNWSIIGFVNTCIKDRYIFK